MDLIDIINEFLQKIKKEETEKIFLNRKQVIDDDELKLAIANTIINAREHLENIQKRKALEKKKLNPINYLDLYTYNINFSDLYIKFYDIIDGIYQPLFEFSMKETKIEFFQNGNPKDSTNLIKYLKSTFLPNDKDKEKFDTYDKNYYLVNINRKFSFFV